jgi:molybdopterin converting factor small subunit
LQVEVRLYASLRRFAPGLGIGESLKLEADPGATLGQLRDRLGLPPDEVRVVMRNSRQAELGDVVEEGDRIAYLPAVAGG